MQHNEDVGTRMDLCKYRLEVSHRDVESAKVLLEIEDYRGANNRAYYAIFHSINAIHALDGMSYKKHKDAIANFNKNYIKTEIFAREWGRKINEAEQIRHASDYDDFYIASKQESASQVELAEELLKLIEDYCNKMIERDGE